LTFRTVVDFCRARTKQQQNSEIKQQTKLKLQVVEADFSRMRAGSWRWEFGGRRSEANTTKKGKQTAASVHSTPLHSIHYEYLRWNFAALLLDTERIKIRRKVLCQSPLL